MQFSFRLASRIFIHFLSLLLDRTASFFFIFNFKFFFSSNIQRKLLKITNCEREPLQLRLSKTLSSNVASLIVVTKNDEENYLLVHNFLYFLILAAKLFPWATFYQYYFHHLVFFQLLFDVWCRSLMKQIEMTALNSVFKKKKKSFLIIFHLEGNCISLTQPWAKKSILFNFMRRLRKDIHFFVNICNEPWKSLFSLVTNVRSLLCAKDWNKIKNSQERNFLFQLIQFSL